MSTIEFLAPEVIDELNRRVPPADLIDEALAGRQSPRAVMARRVLSHAWATDLLGRSYHLACKDASLHARRHGGPPHRCNDALCIYSASSRTYDRELALAWILVWRPAAIIALQKGESLPTPPERTERKGLETP